MLLQEAPGNDLIVLITSTPLECFPLIPSPTVKSERKHVVRQLQEASAVPAVPFPARGSCGRRSCVARRPSGSAPGRRHLFFLWVL